MPTEPIRDIKVVEQLRQEIKNVVDDPIAKLRNEVMFLLLVHTPIRFNALVNIKFSDFNIDKMKVPDDVKEVINNYLEEKNGDSYEYMFVNSEKNKNIHLSRETFRQFLLEAGKVCGIKRCGVNMLRRTYAYHKYKSGVSIDVLRRILNHSSKRQTIEFIGLEEVSWYE